MVTFSHIFGGEFSNSASSLYFNSPLRITSMVPIRELCTQKNWQASKSTLPKDTLISRIFT